MKVLWFINDYDFIENNTPKFGGWIHSLQSLLSSEDNVKLALAFQSKEPRKKSIKDHTTYYPIKEQKHSITRRYLGSDKSKFVKLYIEIINDFKPDVIHIFGTENNFGIISRKVNIPIIIHLQGLMFPYYLEWFPFHIGVRRFRHIIFSEIFGSIAGY